MPTVLGIDFGNDNCVIAAARFNTSATKDDGKNDISVETLMIDGDLAAAPSVVGFGTRNRSFGHAAKDQRSSNAVNTVFGFKRLLGRNFGDVAVSQFAKNYPFKIVPSIEGYSGAVGVTVPHLASDHTYSIDHISGMLLRKLSQTAVRSVNEDVTDCVVSVPSYFTDGERHALLTTCGLIGLNVMQMFEETSAAGLSYGYDQNHLAKLESLDNHDQNNQKTFKRNVFFVDCGESALQVFACSFYDDNFKMIAAVSDPKLGGRDFNQLLLEYFAYKHKKATGLDILKDKKMYWEVMEEVEVIKRHLSTHSSAKKILTLSVENETGGGETELTIARPEFEHLCNPLFSRIESSLRKCLAASGLVLSEIHSVEILGGTTSIPGVQDVISKVFGKNCSTSLNSIEAVAQGCALQCAMNFPNCNGRKYSASSILLNPISFSWEMESSEITLVEVFHKNEPFPISKSITMIHTLTPITFHAVYSSPGPTQNIGAYTVRNNHSSPPHKRRPSDEKKKLSEILVTVCINSNGILEVVKASYVKNEALPPPTDTEVIEVKGHHQPQQLQGSNANNVLSPIKRQPLTELHVHAKESGSTRNHLEKLVEVEERLMGHDLQEEGRLAAKNALKNTLHALKFSTGGSLKSTHAVKELRKKIEVTENWMQDDKDLAIDEYSFIERQQELEEMKANMEK